MSRSTGLVWVEWLTMKNLSKEFLLDSSETTAFLTRDIHARENEKTRCDAEKRDPGAGKASKPDLTFIA